METNSDEPHRTGSDLSWRTLLLAACLAFAAAALTFIFIRFYDGRVSEETGIETDIVFNDEAAMDVWFPDTQGESALIRTPGGEWIMIDCGSEHDSEALIRLLEEMDAHTISMVFITYDAPVRTGALKAILDRFEIGSVYYANALQPGTEKTVLEAGASSATTIRKLTASILPAASIDPDIDIFALSPLDALYPKPSEACAVLRICYGNTSVLFNSEADPLTERLIMKAFPNRMLRSDLIKLGTDNSGEQITDKYLNAVKPSLAIVSNSSGESISLRKLEQRGIEIRSTAELGTIHIRLDGNSFRVVEY